MGKQLCHFAEFSQKESLTFIYWLGTKAIQRCNRCTWFVMVGVDRPALCRHHHFAFCAFFVDRLASTVSSTSLCFKGALTSPIPISDWQMMVTPEIYFFYQENSKKFYLEVISCLEVKSESENLPQCIWKPFQSCSTGFQDIWPT